MKYFLILILLFTGKANGQNPGPRFVAMGTGGAALQGTWSLHQNPAGVAEFVKPAFAVAVERYFPVDDLSTQTALLVIPLHNNVLGFSFERYGIDEYREQITGISYSRKFGEALRLGVAFKYFQLNISQYGTANALSIETGFQLNITEKLIVASHIANPNRSKYENFSGSGLPVKLSFGVSYRFSDRLMMITDLRKMLNYPIDFMAGIEYDLIRGFTLRGGASAQPLKQYAGFGINYQKVQLDFAIGSHPNLGYHPQIALGYEF